MRRCLLACFLFVIGGLLAGPTVSAVAQDTLTIQGQLVVGSLDGSPIPSGLSVELQMVSVRDGLLQTQSIPTNADGTFTFVNVPRFGPEIFYTVSAVYAGLRQSTPPFSADDVDEQGTIELRLYETTDQLSKLEIAQATTQIDFTDLQQVGLKILLELQVFNLGDRIPYFANEVDPTRLVTFHFELPVGAYNIAPEGASGAQRFIIQEGVIPVIYDTQPIFPGWPTPHVIRLSYFLPYEGSAIIDQIFPVSVRNFSVWVPENEIQVTGDLFERTDDQQPEGSRLTYHVYQQKSPLPANENLKFTVAGVPERAATAKSENERGGSALVALLGVLSSLIIGGAVGYWLWVSRRKSALALMDDLSQNDKGTS
ncbi:MAG: hypothetical protein BroJett018_10420 [Chloroflexota bacterium]|nr:hypothetical protein [Chloroflexota bacterium]NOG64774.1 hypothetical protein [Chloroflexota bacterium]GIK63248.1 MAG: hypothetical protein BroJett018_10420 [Chloroflexota bacterium]